MTRKAYLTTAIICLIAIFESTRAKSTHSNAPELSIKGRSFALTTTLNAVHEDGHSFKYEIDEAYSVAQSRSKITYRTIGDKTSWQARDKLPLAGTFYVDNYNVLLFDYIERKCLKSSHETMASLFDLNPLDAESIDQTKLFVGGPARVLFLLEHYRADLVPSNETNLRIRNTPSVMFTLDASKTHLGPVQFSIFYSASTTSEPQVPLEIVMDIKGEMIVVWDFLNVENLLNEGARIDNLDNDQDRKARFDRFAIEPGVGCGQHLSVNNENTLNLDGVEPESFSFRAQVIRPGIREVAQLNVAFESKISSLRVDKLFLSSLSSTLTDYNSGRSYHIMERSGEPSLGPKQDIAQTRPSQLACVVAESPRPLSQMANNLGELLLGASRFLYLGRAKIRGLDVKVYEAYDSKWPVWFRRPSVFHQPDPAKKNVDRRLVRPTNQGQEWPLNTVVYVAPDEDDTSGQPTRKLKGRIVQLDLFWLGALTTSFSETSMALFDFSWQVSVHSACGRGAFSLADLCPASEKDDNHYGRVDMLSFGGEARKTVWDYSFDWFYQVPERTFAYLSMIQSHFGLPISMVYDLTTQILPPTGGKRIRLAASFRLAEHQRQLARLDYLGKGTTKPQYLISLGVIIYHLSFEGCAFLAAHRKTDTYFAYSPMLDKCIVDARSDLPATTTSTPNDNQMAFDLCDDGRLEVYKVSHQEDRTLSTYDSLTRLSHGDDRLEYLNDVKKNTFRLSHGNESIEFKLASLEVSELNQKSPYRLDTETIPDTNKLVGFGLLVADQWNKRILPEPIKSQDNLQEPSQTDMTFRQCHSACMQDLDCKSFSVCIRGHEVECILSSVSFREPNTILQIMQPIPSRMVDSRTSTGDPKIIQVKIDNNIKIQLKKHPNCELHNKIYMDLFRESGRALQPLGDRSVHPVSGREQCAQMCLNHTLAMIKQDVGPDEGARMSQVAGDASSGPKTIKKAMDRHQSIISTICTAFLYLDKADLQTLSEDLRESIKKQNSDARLDGFADGYCLIGDQIGYSNLFQSRSQPVSFQRYSFKFESFYERRFGVRLRSSAEAQHMVKRRSERQGTYIDSKELDSIKSFVDHKYNTQEFTYKDKEACALMCFTQTASIWPGCKSFDIIIQRVMDQQVSICLLNSITLQDAIRSEQFDLIVDDTANGAQVWHYDPQPGFILAESEQQAQSWLAYLRTLTIVNWDAPRVGPLVSVCLTIIGLVGGVILGVKLASKYIDRLSTISEEQTDELVTNVGPTVEFSNLVNLDGQVD